MKKANSHTDNIEYCANCKQAFECRVFEIENCHCRTINLTIQQKNQLDKKYSGCLCRKCLEEFTHN